jgi:hypothetical protein
MFESPSPMTEQELTRAVATTTGVVIAPYLRP